MARPASVAGVAVAVVLLLGASACSGGSDEPATPPPSPTATSLTDLATDDLTVARASFCAQVAPAAVEDALGAEPASADEWANGERAELADGVTDVAHEFGCRWSAADGTTALGWVFAPPITPRRAEELGRAATQVTGCRAVPGAPPFGTHAVAVRCQDGTTAFHGLFGDAWLSCSLQVPAAGAGGGTDVERAGRWCATVLQAAGS